MGAFAVAFLGGALGTFASTLIVRRFALRVGAVDYPSGRRVHRVPTPRLGGLAIAFGLIVALALTHGLDKMAVDATLLGGLLAGILAVLVVGTLDDLRGLGAAQKIVGQFAAALLLWAGGWRVETIGLPGMDPVAAGVLGFPLTVLWVVGVINAVNLIDGLDGLAGGLAVIAALSFAWLLAAQGMPSWIIAVALAGAVFGFLWFNLSPALIFMGDTGSHLLGLVLAAFGLRLSGIEPAGMFPLVPVLLLAVPLADTTWAIVRRAAAQAPGGAPVSLRVRVARVVKSDGAHVHHQLLAAGWTTPEAVGFLWRTAAACALIGLLLASYPFVAFSLAAILAGWAARVVKRSQRVVVAGAAPEGAGADDSQVDGDRRIAA